MAQEQNVGRRLRQICAATPAINAQIRHFAAGTVLLQAGDVATALYLVNRGCLRMLYNDGEHDITLQFFTEDQAVSSFASFYNQVPSAFSLVCVEDVELLELRRTQVMQMIEQRPEVLRLAMDALSKRLGEYTLLLARAKTTPEERYQQLVLTSPAIEQRLTQTMLASYLGISPVSLSRMRKRLGIIK